MLLPLIGCSWHFRYDNSQVRIRLDYWWNAETIIIHQGLWLGKLVPSSHQRSEFSNTILCIFSRWDQKIGEDIPIPDSLGEDICKRPFPWDFTSVDCWKRWANTWPNSVASSLRTLGWSSSGPRALEGFKPLRSVVTPALETISPMKGADLSKSETGRVHFYWTHP